MNLYFIFKLALQNASNLPLYLWNSILEQQEEFPLSEAQKQELDKRLKNYNKD